MTVSDKAQKVEWVENQCRVLRKVFSRLEGELRRLKKKKKTSRKQIHETRVALRHLFSLWSVLREDGWETAKIDRQVISPLKKLLKRLGAVRDIDVNIKIAQKLDCPQALLDEWKGERQQNVDRLKKSLSDIHIKRLVKHLGKYLRKHSIKLSKKIAESGLANEQSGKHALAALQKQEHMVRTLAQAPSSPRQFHKLRLAVKQWRYLMDDLCNSKNETLEQVQSSLGTLHDLDRIKPLLLRDKRSLTGLANLNSMHDKLLFELFDVRNKLPFGFDPLKKERQLAK